MARYKHKYFEPGSNPTDLERDDLLGDVKQMMIITYKAHKKGNEIIQGKIELDYGSNNLNCIRTYNDTGFKTQEQVFSTFGMKIKNFNEKKQWTDEANYKNGKLEDTLTLHYNERGKQIATIRLYADGSLYYRTEDIYDEKGNLLSHYHYTNRDGKEVPLLWTIYKYNEMGKRELVSSYENDGVLKNFYAYKYDERGNEIEEIRDYTDKGSKKFGRRITRKYNKYNDAIETVYYKWDGSIDYFFTQEYEYDENGKKIEPVREPYVEPPPPKGETEETELDHKGNWIKKTTYYNKIPLNIIYREFIYFSESNENTSPLIHPIMNMKKEEKEDNGNDYKPLKPAEAKWVDDSAGQTVEHFPVLRYYNSRFHEHPSCIIYSAQGIEAIALRKELIENNLAVEIHQMTGDRGEMGKDIARYTLLLNQWGYMLSATQIFAYESYDYDVPDNIEEDGTLYFSQIQLLHPSEASGKRDEYFEEQLEEYINKCTIEKKPDKPKINMIEVHDNNFIMKEHAVDDDFEIKDLDVNYGYGFEKFHEELMQRFNNSTKGLVLFHGQPGTGKTYYIRHLLRKMAMSKKVVIYMPPNMVDHLVEPAFMTFLSSEVREWSEQGLFCVLLIEDAEPLLAKRQEGVRIQGVTNLLNMTDGLLNDMLNLQIICTFNVDLKKLDSALLREGRLIARKEFKALSVLDANLLASRLGIKHHFTKPATLGEIYAKRKNHNTLIHDVEHDRDASTNVDDL